MKKLFILLCIILAAETFAQITVQMPDMNPSPGAISVPVNISPALTAGDNVISYQFVVSFNPAVLTATGHSITGALTPAGWTVMSNPTSGQISVAGFGATAVTGSGILVYITFNYIGGYSTLHWNNFTFNAGTPSATLVDGSVPVELTSFTAVSRPAGVELNWKTATEVNNKGFNVQRSSGNEPWKTLSFIGGSGTTSEFHEYSYLDKTAASGVNFYRLEQVDLDGSSNYSEVVEVEVEGINSYQLNQNYPNPFNPSTMISYIIPEPGLVTLKVFGALGNEIRTLVLQYQKEGYYEVTFDAADIGNGVYFYELRANDFRAVKKLILMK